MNVSLTIILASSEIIGVRLKSPLLKDEGNWFQSDWNCLRLD